MVVPEEIKIEDTLISILNNVFCLDKLVIRSSVKTFFTIKKSTFLHHERHKAGAKKHCFSFLKIKIEDSILIS